MLGVTVDPRESKPGWLREEPNEAQNQRRRDIEQSLSQEGQGDADAQQQEFSFQKGNLSFCLQVGRSDQESIPKGRDPFPRVVTEHQIKVLSIGLLPVQKDHALLRCSVATLAIVDGPISAL